MKKYIALLLTLALLCCVLTACGGESQDAPASVLETEPPETEVDTFVVHVYVPDSWGNGKIWAWSDTEGDAFDAWPGMALNADGDGWYYYEVPEWVEHIIISGLGGSLRTADLDIESREVWIGIDEAGGAYIDYVPYEMPQGGYIQQLEGEWESVYLQDNNSNINANALVFSEMVEDCYEMTVHIDIEMLGGTSCKDWQVWIRSGGTFVKLEQMYLEAGDGYTYETFTFDTPISFDAIAVTAKASGGYSYYAGIAVTDVWYES